MIILDSTFTGSNFGKLVSSQSGGFGRITAKYF